MCQEEHITISNNPTRNMMTENLSNLPHVRDMNIQQD